MTTAQYISKTFTKDELAAILECIFLNQISDNEIYELPVDANELDRFKAEVNVIHANGIIPKFKYYTGR